MWGTPRVAATWVTSWVSVSGQTSRSATVWMASRTMPSWMADGVVGTANVEINKVEYTVFLWLVSVDAKLECNIKAY